MIQKTQPRKANAKYLYYVKHKVAFYNITTSTSYKYRAANRYRAISCFSYKTTLGCHATHLTCSSVKHDTSTRYLTS